MENNRFINSEKKPLVKLYRYFSNIEYALKEIESGEIFLTYSHTFNDPFDCRIVNDGYTFNKNFSGDKEYVMFFVNGILLHCQEFIELFFADYDFDTMESEFKESVKDVTEITVLDYVAFVYKYANIKQSFDDFWDLLKDAYIKSEPLVSIPKKIACFSEINNSILMWSYYANKHTGICLEYTPTELNLENEEEKLIFESLQKVFYSENQYNQNKYFTSGADIYDIFFNKAQCWAHEQEWRIVLENDEDTLKIPCLTGIYLGVNFRNTYASLLKDNYFVKVIKSAIKHNPRIPVYEAKLNGEKYQIDFDVLLSPEKLP